MVYDFDILLKIDLQNLFYLEVRYIYLEYLHFFALAIATVFVFQAKIFQTFALYHYEPIKLYHFSLFFIFQAIYLAWASLAQNFDLLSINSKWLAFSLCIDIYVQIMPSEEIWPQSLPKI